MPVESAREMRFQRDICGICGSFLFFFYEGLYEVLIILEGKSFFIVSRGDYFCFFLFDFVY